MGKNIAIMLQKDKHLPLLVKFTISQKKKTKSTGSKEPALIILK